MYNPILLDVIKIAVNTSNATGLLLSVAISHLYVAYFLWARFLRNEAP